MRRPGFTLAGACALLHASAAVAEYVYKHHDGEKPFPFLKRIGVPLDSGKFNEDVILRAVASNADGAICVAGTFNTTVVIEDGPTYTGLGGPLDIIVASFDKYGELVWSRQLASTGQDSVEKVAISKHGDCYVVGSFSQGLRNKDNTANVITSEGGIDGFIAKLDYRGSLRWATRIGGAGADAVAAITLGEEEEAYVAGYYTGSATISNVADSTPNTLAAVGAAQDMYLARIDTCTGAVLDISAFGGNGNDRPYALEYDHNCKSLYVGGDFNSTTLSIGTKTLQKSQSSLLGSGFVAKINTYGMTVAWAKRYYATNGAVVVSDFEYDSNGDVFISGKYRNVSLDSTAVLQDGEDRFSYTGASSFVARLKGRNGNLKWVWTGATSPGSVNPPIVYDEACGVIRMAGIRIFGALTYVGNLITVEIDASTGKLLATTSFGREKTHEFYVFGAVPSNGYLVTVGYTEPPRANFTVDTRSDVYPVGGISARGLKTGLVTRLPLGRLTIDLRGATKAPYKGNYAVEAVVHNPSCAAIHEAEIKFTIESNEVKVVSSKPALKKGSGSGTGTGGSTPAPTANPGGGSSGSSRMLNMFEKTRELASTTTATTHAVYSALFEIKPKETKTFTVVLGAHVAKTNKVLTVVASTEIIVEDDEGVRTPWRAVSDTVKAAYSSSAKSSTTVGGSTGGNSAPAPAPAPGSGSGSGTSRTLNSFSELDD